MLEALLHEILISIGKRESIPFGFMLAICSWLLFMYERITKKDNLLNCTDIMFVSALIWGALLIYIIVCLVADHLPKARKDSIGVLFDIEAESDSIYESIKYNLADNFQGLAVHENAPLFDAVCVKRKKVQRYHRGSTELSVKLLEKTRCAIKVEVRCSVDNVTQIENYSLKINYDIMAPSINEQAKRMLTEDVRPLGKSVEKLHFSRAKTIDYFDFTAQTLVEICQYLVGCIYLLTGNVQEAIGTLKQLKETIESKQQNDERIGHLKELINCRLFLCYNEIVRGSIENFKKTKEFAYLKSAQGALKDQNRLYPNTYAYCMNMAYTSIALNRDFQTAKKCIDMCKAVKYDYAWAYNDAFLSAYSGLHPMVIKRKYEMALEHPTESSTVDLIDYIEFIIEQEPGKAELHLAAGILYGAVGDAKQMKRHFAQFEAQYSALDSRTERYLKGKMNAIQCADQCNNNCLNCR